MANYTTQDIRNVALIGHAGAGKTLLAEALLHHAGAIRTRGELARGTTVCDFDAQEKELEELPVAEQERIEQHVARKAMERGRKKDSRARRRLT